MADKEIIVFALLTKPIPSALRPYSKAVLAFLGSVVAYLAYAHGDSEWGAAAVQLATVLGVYGAPNAVEGAEA